MEILVNSNQYIEDQAKLLLDFYRDFTSRVLDYSELETYRSILQTNTPHTSIFTGVDEGRVETVCIVTFEGSRFMDVDCCYNIDMIAYRDPIVAIEMIDEIRSRDSLPINCYKLTQEHRTIFEDMKVRSSEYYWFYFKFRIENPLGSSHHDQNDVKIEPEGNGGRIAEIDASSIKNITEVIDCHLNTFPWITVDNNLKIRGITDPGKTYEYLQETFEILEKAYGAPSEANYMFVLSGKPSSEF